MRASIALLASAIAVLHDVHAGGIGTISGKVRSYEIKTPDIGSCRLKGIDEGSANFKNYASVPGNDVTMNEGCGRCVRVTCAEEGKCTAGSSITAYVLDVAPGAKSGEIKLSKAALIELSIDPNANDVGVSYKMINCPSSFLSGNVKACLMEGASNSYIPLQFYNSQKVVKSVMINGVEGQQQKDTFFFSAQTQQGKQLGSDWYKNVEVALTANDGEQQKASFEFGGPTGCATSSVQFSAASTSDGNDEYDEHGNKKSSGGSGMILGAVLGGVGALIVVIGSIMFIRRRRAANDDAADIENQYLSPRPPKQAPAAFSTMPASHGHGGAPESPANPEVSSPTAEYNHATSPASAYKPMPPASTTASTTAPIGSSFVAVSSVEAAAPVTAPPAPVYQHGDSMSSDGSYSFSSEGPKYSYSSDMKYSFSSNMSDARTSTLRPEPLRAANPRVAHLQSEPEEERTSFDIDDLRSTEPNHQVYENDQSFASDYAAAQHTSYASSAVTSPQSYVRATSLRRNSSSRDAPSFGPPAVQRSSSSFKDTSGYSRDSLNILEYPYAKRTGRNGSVTG